MIGINSYFEVSGLLTILGLLLGFLYWLDKRRDPKRKLSHDAFKSFEQTFTPALHLLDDPKQTSYVIVADELPKHEDAILAFEHILRGTKSEARFKTKCTEYINKCEEIRQYGYNICLGEDGGPPTIGILEHIQDRQGNLREIELDRAYKEKLKELINELLEIAKY
uniref:Uncharacterized protein n=1 Tax=Candidatus Desulfatibia profunda TaxID=2841695 RepID=A0A8J6NL09_9BACT|nr:hypothetical protein [Candidatus Desulfatibia profunda]